MVRRNAWVYGFGLYVCGVAVHGFTVHGAGNKNRAPCTIKPYTERVVA